VELFFILSFQIFLPKINLDWYSIHYDMLQVFDRIRTECPDVFNKVVSVHGDVSETDLGLSDEDRQRVVTKVNVVFHAAATVRFNESLKSAVTLNTLGTQRVIQVCRDIQNLQVSSCAIHWSYLGGSDVFVCIHKVLRLLNLIC
jgi:Putative dehydrogenase domain of multifunctional non-ribosomal peptide synthetases and related enzymes